MSDDQNDPEDDLRRMLREFLEGSGSFNPQDLASAAGLPTDPNLIAQMMQQFQQAMNGTPGQTDWTVSAEQARTVAKSAQIPVTDEDRKRVDDAFRIAAMWLSEQTTLVDSAAVPRVMNRTEWADQSMHVWVDLAKPVADSISNALLTALSEQIPGELQGMLTGASSMIRGIGGTLFAIQLGQVVGQLSSEVVSATEVGIPLFPEHTAALIPQNVVEFGRDLDIDAHEIDIYLATRELAHAALFASARWLSLHVINAIRDYASGIAVSIENMQELASDFDPSDPEQLREAIRSGALIPPKTQEQLAALARLETLFALIEGWVDRVTQQATVRLPKHAALGETVTRRRATGGPAEQAFGALIGLELRPRKLREAAAMWRTVDEQLGADVRDSLWRHPDMIPTADDITDPSALVARLQNPPAPDDLDRDLERLLAGELDAGSSHDDTDGPTGGDPTDTSPTDTDPTDPGI